MKLKNSGMVLISMLILLGSCFTVAATSISDGTNDIWHWTQTGTSWSWQGNVGNKPNIDITEISYSLNEEKVTLSMKVSGVIETADNIVYMMYYNSTDTSYFVTYRNEEKAAIGMKGMNFTSSDDIMVSGNILRVELDVLGDTSQVDLWGYAAEYTEFGDVTGEWWGDWAPNEKFTSDSGDDGNGDDGDDEPDGGSDDGSDSTTNTPGFEIIMILVAVAVAFILLRKRY